MAAKVWTGLGADDNWSTGLNWDLSTVPATTDTITFNATSVKNCTVDNVGTWTGGTLTAATTYTGTITQGVDFSVASTFTLNNGSWVATGFTFTGGAGVSLATGGSFTQGGVFTCVGLTVAAGTFTGSSSTINTGTVTINNASASVTATSGNWNLSGGWSASSHPTFWSNGGGTITLVGTASQTFTSTSTNTPFNLVIISKDIGSAGNITVDVDSSLPLGASPTSYFGTGTLTITGTITVSGAWATNGTIIVSATTGTVSGALTSLAFDRSLTINTTATFPASVALAWTGSATSTITATATTFGTSTLVRTGVTTVAAGTTFPLGASPTTSTGINLLTVTGTMTASGLWVHTGSFTVSAAGTVSGGFTRLTVDRTFTVTAGGTWQAGAALTMAAVTASDINASGVVFGSPCIVNGTTTGVVDVKTGTTFPLGTDPTVTTGGGDFRTEGTITVSGTWTQSNATNFEMLGGGVVTGTFTLVLNEATIDADAGGTTWPSTGSITINITSAGSQTVSLGGKTVGTFRRTGSGSGLLVLQDSATYAAFNDNQGLVAHTIRFTASTTHSAAAWDLRGSSGKLLTIESSSATNHVLTTTGGVDIVCANISVSNSTVDAAPVWYAGATPPSVDGGGGNVNWIFSGPPNAAKLRKSAVLV